MGIEAEDEALFWIARESTGSLRDAFTLFDQVASFSSGHIRGELIREKLGLVGLERLNELAEACAEGDAARGFELLDGILASGVAIEQLIIDLAAYYRSLLLLNNAVSRESLLGYRAERFSSKVRDSLDSPRLEQALELLLDCYRDIRYSVSPRFELETVVSKLSWLKHWISAVELKAAVEEARKALGGGIPPRPLAGGGPPAELPGKTAEPGPAPSLSEEFRRRMARHTAAREAPAPPSGWDQDGAREPGALPPAGRNREPLPRPAESAPDDDEDVPMWSRAGRESAGPAVEEASLDPQAQRVLQIFRGTVVKRGAIEH
jgi:DNA polymerase-3 subunit gamma/tau